MAYPNIFDNNTTTLLISRLNKLNANSIALWGKMNIGQMLHHINL